MPEAMEKTIAILLLDDHALFRESLVRCLHAEPGLEVVAQCGSIEEALRVLERRQVDVVLLDLDLGKHNGTQFPSSAKQQGFGGKILVVTAGVDQNQAAELIHDGISGIFMKHHSAALLAQDRKSTRLNSSHLGISYAVFCLKKKNKIKHNKTLK